jgi:probable blue pigment (indigoidine) exporter
MLAPFSLHPALALVAAAACWGLGTVVTKHVLADVPPLTLLALQLAASCLFLLAVTRIGRSPRIRWSPQLRRLAALGVLNPGLAYALSLVGLTSISASMSVLLWATEPVLIALLAVLVLRERVSAVLAVAMGVAVVGALLVVFRPDAAGRTTGIMLTLGAVGACALYSVLTRWLILDDAATTVVLVQQATALGFAVLVAVVADVVGAGHAWRLTSMTPAGWLAAAGSGVLYYGLAFWLYLTGLRHLPAAVAGSFIALVPVFGVAAGHLAGERLSALQWAGAVIAVSAVAVVAARPIDRDRAT